MDARCAVLGPAHVQPASIKLNLMPLQVAHLRSIPWRYATRIMVASRWPCRLLLAASIRRSTSRSGEIATCNCEVFSAWCAAIDSLFCHEKSLSSKKDWIDNTLFLHSQLEK